MVCNGQKRINALSNYDERIVKIKNVIELWQLRRLALLGKITLIKSLLVSQFICIWTPLPTCTEALLKVNKLLFEFLWDCKGDMITLRFITKDHEEGGGLRAIDINTFNKFVKAFWIKKYLDPTNSGKWIFFMTVKKCMVGN